MVFYIIGSLRDTILACTGILEKISPSEHVSKGYIQIIIKCDAHAQNSVSFYLYFCCYWINVTQINFQNIKRNIQRIISDSCFQLKSWFNVDARVPSIPLLNRFDKGIIEYMYVSTTFLCLHLLKSQRESEIMHTNKDIIFQRWRWIKGLK